MSLFFLPAVYALFVWWFSTGVIVYLDGLPRSTFGASFAFLSVLLLLALIGVYNSRNDISVTGAYLSFTYGLVVWGWQVASFYMGLLTGPQAIPCPAGVRGWARFTAALGACLYHELASIAGALMLAGLAWGAQNQGALYAYLVLWGLHQSAKLIVFFGARNLNEEYLPEHMKFLASYFQHRPMNWFFPIAVTAATVVAVLLCMQAASAARAFDAVTFSFLGCMAALGLLELWLLMLPLPLHLWDWGLSSHRAREAEPGTNVSGVSGTERSR